MVEKQAQGLKVVVLPASQCRGLNPLLVKADEVVSRYGKNADKED